MAFKEESFYTRFSSVNNSIYTNIYSVYSYPSVFNPTRTNKNYRLIDELRAITSTIYTIRENLRSEKPS